MARRNLSNRLRRGNSILNDLLKQWRWGVAASQAKRNDLVEELESRVFLSHTVTTLVHPTFVAYTGHSHHTMTASGVVGLTPNQLRQAYGVNLLSFGGVTSGGAGQTIAIVDAYNAPTITTDLATFDSTFGLPNPTLTIINQNGGTSLPTADTSERGNSWAVETSLDVEYAHAMAPEAKIVLVEANSANNSDLYAAINTARNYAGVSVVSMSWGGSESSSDPSSNSYFTTPSGHTGVTFIASSGDSGAYDYYYTSTKAVEYPAASPNVLSVGGTLLNVDSSGNYISESGWGSGTSSGINGGSGGGISTYESQPSYQSGVVTQTSTKRALPDVSFDASPNSGVAVIDTWDFGSSDPWAQIGGTSLAAPSWAGIIALVNQDRALSGLKPLDGATQTLPGIYSLSAADFHDITTGNNGYAAGVGYDLVTGRGTPIVNQLVPALAGVPTTPTPVITALTANPTPTIAGTTVTLSATGVQETGGTISSVAFYRESNGTSGLQVGSDTTLTGSVTHSGTTWSLSLATAGMASGTYTYYAVAVDSSGVKSTVSSTTLTIVTPTPVIASLTDNPSSTAAGTSVTFTANNVTETGGTVSSVAFYRESNGTSGLQIGSDTALTGSVTLSGNSYSIGYATTGMAPGTYTFYAVATDTAGVTSAVASTTLTIAAPASSNDNFANATVIPSAQTATVYGSNVGATKESGEPVIITYNSYGTGANAGGKSVWWNWTAPVTGKVSLNTHGSNFDTILGVFTGNTVSTLTEITGNDDDPAGGTLTSALTFNAVAGTTYHFVVDGYNAASGNITLNLAETVAPAAPANDNFANAVVLPSGSSAWTGSNVSATKEPGEPNIANNRGGASIWFSWTATTSRSVSLNTLGSNFDTLLGVYTGSSVSSLSLVAGNDDSPAGGTLTSALTFNAVAGTTYYIAVDGYNGATGNVTLNLI